VNVKTCKLIKQQETARLPADVSEAIQAIVAQAKEAGEWRDLQG
jgi:hypothetical protein